MARPRIKHISAQELNRRTLAELKQQYVKQSYEARRRYKELQAKYPGSEIVQRRQGDFKPLRQMKGITKKELAMELSDVTRFLSASSSRVNEYEQVRSDTVETFHLHGYEDVTEKNLDPMIQFLEDARQRHLAAIYDSKRLVEVFNRAVKRGLTREQVLGNIEYWAEHGTGKEKPRLYASRHSSVTDFYAKLREENSKR